MIRLLDETTVGQIAAGEVVDRPLSVVKELVENALDAGARRIAVALVRGGLESIEVIDDGGGIAETELGLAFARHATSKLAQARDLENIATLGFRGEGLAAIAAVARVRLLSRTHDQEIGYAVEAHGLEVSTSAPVAAPPGSRVVVRGLFANVPARRAYLRAPSTEFARVSTFLATLSLAYPDVAFSLAHDGRPTFAFPPASDLAQRLAHVFGLEPSRALLAIAAATPSSAAVEDADPELCVRGYISTPGTDRADRRLQLLFVNGRLLRTTQLAGAWSAAYASYALAGRQPFGVLFLDLAPAAVDPNVHPTKSDVRLRQPEQVQAAVRGAIAATLQHNATTRMRDALSLGPSLESGAVPPVRLAERNDVPAFAWDWGAGVSALVGAHARSQNGPAEMRVLAQLDDTFLLASDGRALVLVDQHAAHERVAFEAIAEHARGGATVGESLLVPYVVELDVEEAERFESAREALAQAGLEAEPFGERAYRIVATPAGYGARRFDIREYISDLREIRADLRDEIRGLDARERVWASLACHSVVRAGEALEHAEMSALLARLMRCRNPMHCPHGRPTIVRIEADAVARMFKRT